MTGMETPQGGVHVLSTFPLSSLSQVFAVATLDSIIIMDTEHMTPLALVGGVHWSSITDLTW